MFEHFYKPAKSSLNCCYCYSPLYSVLGLFTTTRLEVKNHYSQGTAQVRKQGGRFYCYCYCYCYYCGNDPGAEGGGKLRIFHGGRVH